MKTVCVTGAASGIGLALTEVCLQKTFTVIMVDKNSVELQHQAERLTQQFPHQLSTVHCDITKPEETTQLAQFAEQHHSQIDWLFNNAGIIGHLAPLWELELEQIQQVMEVNLYGMINVIRAMMPLLLRQNNPAHLINMASLYALCAGSQVSAYSMSKHGVLALSESLYFDLQRLEKPIQVSVVFPSFTNTALLTPATAEANPLHHALNELMHHSRPALEVAQHIIREVEQNKFYILPDKEVKAYCEERTKALVMQEPPYKNNVEKLMTALIKRNTRL